MWPASSEFQRFRPRHVEHENLAVADPAGARGPRDPVRHFLDAIVAHPDVDLDLGQVGQAVLAADVAVEIPLLPAVPLGLTYHARGYAQLGYGAEHCLGAERLDDNRELFHR